jgi:hypothetical protein
MEKDKRSYHPSQAILLLSKPQSGLKEGLNAANLLRRFALMKIKTAAVN